MAQTPAPPRLCPQCRTPNNQSADHCVVCGRELDPSPAGEVPWLWWEGMAVWFIATATAAVVSLIVALSVGGDVLRAAIFVIIPVTSVLWTLGWLRTRHGAGLKALGWHGDRIAGDVGSGIAAGVGGFLLQIPLIWLTLLIGRIFAGRRVSLPDQIDYKDPSGALLAFTGFAVIVLAPFAEELLFRGLLYQGLRRRFGIGAGAVASAGLFALAHISPLFFLPIGAFGYILARTFERRGSILANIVAHAVFNAIGYALIVRGL